MKALLTLVVLLASIAAGHAAVLHLAPSFIMGRAMAAMEQRGIPTHAFRLAPRMTPQTQTVVRPSPDLAYSLCLFDFSDGVEAVEIEAAAWGDYASVSLFDERTDNFARQRGNGERIALRLLPPGSPEAKSRADGIVVAPSHSGIVLIRRLAPTKQAYREIEKIAVQDECRAVEQGGNGT